MREAFFDVLRYFHEHPSVARKVKITLVLTYLIPGIYTSYIMAEDFAEQELAAGLQPRYGEFLPISIMAGAVWPVTSYIIYTDTQ